MYIYCKRFFDIIGSLLGLIIFSPIFLIIAIWIKVDDSSGSVFYSQTRVGLDRVNFKMYKFRSMYVDADERLQELLNKSDVEGAMFKMKNDPRITNVGKFIRKYSLDELPQLWNVLIGDMSLVGPRPPLLRETKKYTEYDFQRLTVKPGCTGWWQVNGRNSVGFDDMVKLDLDYIEKQSFLFDFKIVLRTIKVMIIPNDAY